MAFLKFLCSFPYFEDNRNTHGGVLNTFFFGHCPLLISPAVFLSRFCLRLGPEKGNLCSNVNFSIQASGGGGLALTLSGKQMLGEMEIKRHASQEIGQAWQNAHRGGQRCCLQGSSIPPNFPANSLESAPA